MSTRRTPRDRRTNARGAGSRTGAAAQRQRGRQNLAPALRTILGLHETERWRRSSYLRGYEKQYHHSLQLTAAAPAGTRPCILVRAQPQALARRVAAIEAAGRGRGWMEQAPGHGRAYRFETPEGQRIDHMNLMVADAGGCRDFMVDLLGFHERERVEVDDGGR